jgi:hypothetical protein
MPDTHSNLASPPCENLRAEMATCTACHRKRPNFNKVRGEFKFKRDCVNKTRMVIDGEKFVS